MTLKLYDNPYASAPVRVRIVLQLKGLPFERIPVAFDYHQSLLPTAAYRGVNPQAMVPAIVEGDFVLWQSLAIVEYLEECHPSPPILPRDARGRARVRCLAAMIACDAQPMVNFRVRERLKHDFGMAEEEVLRWVRQWLSETLAQYEQAVAADPATGRLSHGDTPTLADVCLFPHVLHAKRFGVPLDPYRTVLRIFDECMAIPAFRDSRSEQAG